MVRGPYKISVFEIPRWLGHFLPLIAARPVGFDLLLRRMSSLEGSFILCRVLHLFESRDLFWELFHAPALADLCVVDVRGPLSPINGGFQRFHEACSRIHPMQQLCSEVSYLRLVSAGSSLLRGFCRGVRAPLVYL